MTDKGGLSHEAGHFCPSAGGAAGRLCPSCHAPGAIDLEQIKNGFLVCTTDPFSHISYGSIYFMDESHFNGQTVAALADIYLWDGTAFVLTEQRLIYDGPGKE